jgi:hypothetical protein
MTPEQRIAENNATFWRLRPMIDQTYPKGRLVAINGGKSSLTQPRTRS